MNQKLQNLLDAIQQSSHLSDDEIKALSKTVKEVEKEMEITSFKLDRTEKVKRTTAILLEETIEELEQKRKAIEATYHELEIESSLERVRTVAMTMMKPDNLLNIAESVFKELQCLGFTELRNAIIQTFVDDKKYFNDYDFSDVTGGWISRIPYTGHPIIEKFVKNIRKNSDVFVETVISGKEMEEWMAFRKANGEVNDPRLYGIQELFYYHYSIGEGDIGISTFSSISAEKQNLLKRFRNVFDLAYQRYTDIQKAEEQAREAQLETSLERVRAQAMAMRKPEDLTGICEVLYAELHTLGFAEIRNAMINIHDDEKETFVNYDYSNEIGKSINHLTYNIHPLIEKQIKEIRNAEGFSETSYTGKDLEDMITFRKKIGEKDDPRIEQANTLYYYFYSIGTGSIGISTFNIVAGEKLDVLKRFRNVFTLAYQRYTDIALAEAQAREAQIEAAMEKVRSRSLVMHKSDELNEVVAILFEKLKELKIPFTAVGIGIYINGSKDLNAFVCGENEGGLVITNYRLPYFNHKIAKDFNKARTEQLEFFIGHYSKEEKDAFYTYVFEHTEEFRYLPDDIKRMIFESPSYTITMVAVNHALFNINDFEGKTLSENEVDIIKRFAKVFDQTYTRFLDLQKAEAQAREAQIELGLERVRSRAMAMQNSNELAVIVDTVFKELTKLNVLLDRCIIMIYDPKTLGSIWWLANPEPAFAPVGFLVKYHEHKPYLDYIKAWKDRTLKWEYVLEGTDKKEWDEFVFAETELSLLPAPVIAGMKSFDRIFLNVSFNNFGSLTASSVEPIQEEHFDILLRFAKVFDSTYTRFNDLKQAEAQVREAQIELGLERVRARAMAMQKSDELADAAQLLYREFGNLDINTFSCGYMFVDEAKQTQTAWVVLPDGSLLPNFIVFPLKGDQVLDSRYKDWKEKKPIHVFELKGEANKEHHRFLANYVPPFVVDDIFSKIPDRIIFNCANFSDGYLLILAAEHFSPAEQQTIIRFTKVFEQTYTRFLDLQKAEAQAREAKIETALEKARSRTMGMHSSDELPEVANVLFLEVQALGIPAWSCGYNILTEDKKSAKCWMSSEGTLQTPFKLRLFGEASFAEWGDFLHSEKTMLVQELGDKALDEHYAYMKSFPDLKSTFDQIGELGLSLPTYQINHLCKFTQGFLLFITYEKVPDAHEIFKRFTKVFEQTYTRFLDLKNAEAREVIAVREASLDRVRGEIASMRTAEDLQRITPLVWRELTALGVPFFRCGLFIVDELAEVIHFYLSTPDGKPLAALELPFQGINVTKEAIANWRLQKVYTTHWSKEEFIAFANNLLDQGQIKNTSTYLGGSEAPESLTLQFVPFKQGMLYVGSENVLNELQIDSVKALANAFSTAYARYEDFIKLESAKQQIEKTLEELKATQKQLIQSEKMASLGELTAGIAHEIQNPLNFVNNFSEVSTELLDEMNVEIAKGNLEDAKQIAEDLKQNLQKINHHGKRAGDIVKGMLQHSRNTSNTTKEPTDINKLADEYLRLAYHGLRAKDKSFNATMKTNFDESLSADEAGIGNINIIPQDIGRVILNLITNAFYAVNEKKKSGIEGYEPTVSISTKKENNKVLITVKDNGNGIPQKILDKIFQPFFTTKPTGQGTGLGLSLSYDIVKAHGGDLKVETKEGEGLPAGQAGSTFIIQLPIP